MVVRVCARLCAFVRFCVSLFVCETAYACEHLPPSLQTEDILAYLRDRSVAFPSVRALHFPEHPHGYFLVPWASHARHDIRKLISWLELP